MNNKPMPPPLVSIICLCYNQAPFVKAAIQSVWTQTYENLELIVVDDASTDDSKKIINDLIKGKGIRFIDLKSNLGNCAAFNLGFKESKGEFVIDLAADDLLLPARIEAGIHDFATAPENAGVHFSDAFLINSRDEVLGTHYPRDENGQLLEKPPEGNIYQELISRYFICPPTIMTKREVLEQLNGYDEALLYEDFDFWIRSSRTFEYIFNKAPLVKKRNVKNSHSSSQFAFRSKHLDSTYKVCRKIFELNKTLEEDKALINRINYEMRQCLKTFNFGLLPKYRRLKGAVYRRLSSPSSIER